MIRYKKGYKYQLVENYTLQTDIRPADAIYTRFIYLSRSGQLTLFAGYAWDGASGGIDTKTFLRGSLVHDALCQLMGDGHISRELYWGAAADLLHQICIEDGMNTIRAWWVRRGVLLYGKISSGKQPEVMTAP